MSDLPSPIQIHDNLMEFFRAGDEYRKPYGAAFMFQGDEIAKQFIDMVENYVKKKWG